MFSGLTNQVTSWIGKKQEGEDVAKAEGETTAAPSASSLDEDLTKSSAVEGGSEKKESR